MKHSLPHLEIPDHSPRFSLRYLLPQYWLTWLAVVLIWLLTYSPKLIRVGLARRLGRFLYRRSRKRRAIVETNLQWCFPDKQAEERDALAQAYFEMAAIVLFDFGLLWFAGRRKLNQRIRVQGVEHLEQAYQAQGRVIALTCHNLGLEYGAQMLSQDFPIVGLVKQVRNDFMDWLLSHGRTRFLCRLFLRDAGIRNIVKAVRAGYVFYYLPDEDLGGTKKTTFIPFFGIQTATLTALGKLARTCDAAVVPCITHYDWQADQYVVKFRAALDDVSEKDEIAAATRMNEILESMIREAPEQYMWSLRIFQTRPEGEETPYFMQK